MLSHIFVAKTCLLSNIGNVRCNRPVHVIIQTLDSPLSTLYPQPKHKLSIAKLKTHQITKPYTMEYY